MNNLTDIQRHRIATALTVFLSIVSVYFVAKLINEIKTGSYIGSTEAHTIAVSGKGEVSAVPDIATLSFTARGEAKTQKEAQTKASEIGNKAIAYAKEAGIAEKDIKTEYYSSSPKYDYFGTVPCRVDYCPPQPQQKISGYITTQTITLKVRDTDKAGEILAGLGAIGVSDISGPNFAIDDEDKLQADARELAIKDAREKAEVLARDLGVRIVRVSSFQENSGYYPYAMYDKAVANESAGSTGGTPPPDLPKGENKITINVTITYEIR